MILPQLANNIENHSRAERYFKDDNWWVTQKLDGKRVLVVASPDEVYGLNRKGEKIDLPANLKAAFARFISTKGSYIVDGEFVSGKLWLFDLPQALGAIVPTDPYRIRREALDSVYEAVWEDIDDIGLVPAMKTEADKRGLYAWTKENHCEGIMFNNCDGIYHEGKRSNDLLKVKFVETVDVIILATWREGKRSVGVGLYEDGKVIDVGSVTMTEYNLELAQVGQVMEAKYLYVKRDRRLYQPRFVRFRDDKSPDECTIDQLKFTNETVRA